MPSIDDLIIDARQTADKFKRNDAYLALQTIVLKASVWAANRYKNSLSDDEIISAQNDALMYMVENYNPSCAANFATQYSYCLMRKLQGAYWERNAIKRGGTGQQNHHQRAINLSLASPTDDGDSFAVADPKADHVRQVDNKIDSEILATLFRPFLAPKELIVFNLSLSDLSLASIAELSAMTFKQADNALERIKHKSRQFQARLDEKQQGRNSQRMRRME
jgi:hypothetical protein